MEVQGLGGCWRTSEKQSPSPELRLEASSTIPRAPFLCPDPTPTQFPGLGAHQRNWGRRNHCPERPLTTHPAPRLRAGQLCRAPCTRAAAPASTGAGAWLACAATWREDEAPGGSPRVASRRARVSRLRRHTPPTDRIAHVPALPPVSPVGRFIKCPDSRLAGSQDLRGLGNPAPTHELRLHLGPATPESAF